MLKEMSFLINGLTKEFCKMFWSELKEPFMNSFNKTKISQRPITSKTQVVKLIQKKIKIKD